jgi:hypothetical protein
MKLLVLETLHRMLPCSPCARHSGFKSWPGTVYHARVPLVFFCQSVQVNSVTVPDIINTRTSLLFFFILFRILYSSLYNHSVFYWWTLSTYTFRCYIYNEVWWAFWVRLLLFCMWRIYAAYTDLKKASEGRFWWWFVQGRTGYRSVGLQSGRGNLYISSSNDNPCAGHNTVVPSEYLIKFERKRL